MATITISASTPSNKISIGIDGVVVVGGHGTIKYPGITVGVHEVEWVISGQPNDVYMASITESKVLWAIQGNLDQTGQTYGKAQFTVS